MALTPDALLGRIVTVATVASQNRAHAQSEAETVATSSRWRVTQVDVGKGLVWFRSVATGKRQRDPSTLVWLWKCVGDGSLILE